MNYLDKLYPALAYFKHLTKSKTSQSIHSPFVFELYNNIIKKTDSIEGSDSIEEIREHLLFRKSFIDVIDYGAYSYKQSDQRRIKDITAISVSDKRKCQLFYNLIKYLNPTNIVELGTSFGLTTMYMALAAPEAKIFTVEGCSQTISIAIENFEKLNYRNIFTTNSTFDVAFQDILNNIGKADFIFFDGNHLKEPTLRYFEMSLPHIHNDTVFIFDDIHWSSQMNSAWESIKKNELLTVTIDLYYFGIIFFKKELSKQDFTLSY